MDGNIKAKKGQMMTLEGLAYGILIVAVVIIVGVYLVVQLQATIASSGGSVSSINYSNQAAGNVSTAFVSMATLLGLVVLVGVIGIILLMLRGGSFGGRA